MRTLGRILVGFFVIGSLFISLAQNTFAEEKNVIDIKIDSVKELGKEELVKIQDELKRQLGQDIKVTYIEKPKLVTGNIVFWTLVTFGVLVIVLGKFGWKPIVEALDVRINKIKDEIEGAEKTRKEADKVLEEQKRILDESRAKADFILVNAKADGTQIKDELVSKAQIEANDIINKGKEEVELVKSHALDELKKEVSVISINIAGKIIGKSLSAKDHEELILNTLHQHENWKK